MSEQSKTPRTDALLSGIDSFGNIPTMEDRYQRMGRHARQLETELAAMRAALVELVEIERRDNLTDPAMTATDTHREKSWDNARTLLKQT